MDLHHRQDYTVSMMQDRKAIHIDRRALTEIIKNVNRFSDIKYAIYRMAYKVIALQNTLRVPNVRIISSIFAHHCLSISESSFVLEACELEAILSDIYFAAHKEGSFSGDIDKIVELTLHFLLDVYDSEHHTSLNVLSAKVALTILSDDTNKNKWHFLFNTVADHNGCISPRRLASLLIQISTIAEYLNEKTIFGRHLVQNEVDKCFAKTPGMLGLSEHGLSQWLNKTSHPGFLSWMDVISRIRQANSIQTSDDSTEQVIWKCSTCNKKNPQGLKFKCSQCWGMMLCEKCYLFNETDSIPESSPFYKHKQSHTVKEVFDAQAVPSKCLIDFMKSFKRLLSCRIRFIANEPQTPVDNEDKEKNTENNIEAKTSQKMFTSTVGKASGHVMADPKNILQDIIEELETHNLALKNMSSALSDELQDLKYDRKFKQKFDNHFKQIATQIERLVALQNNLLFLNKNTVIHRTPKMQSKRTIGNDIENRIPAFEMFSPIPVLSNDVVNETGTMMEHKAINHTAVNHQRIASGNIDTISHVSMSDISAWIVNDAENNKDCDEASSRKHPRTIPESMTMDDKFNADLASVAASNNNMKELNADLDNVLDRLQTILANNFSLDEINFDNTQLQETAFEMEGLLGTLIRGVEQRRTRQGDKV